jgi:hypothetical protein
MQAYAVRTTHGDLNGDLTIASGEAILVHSIVCTNIDTTDTFQFTFSTGDGTDVQFLSIAVPPGESKILEQPFKADLGIKGDTLGATDGPTAVVTVFHSNAGA